MAFTTYNGVRLSIPARGDRNWDATMAAVTYTNIAAHRHTGDPDGFNLVTGSYAADSVTDAKIRLTNTGWLRARNAANSADVNILRVNSSNTIELGASTEVTGTISATGGVTGSISSAAITASTVATTDIDGGTASNTSRLTLPKNTTANLTGLTRKQGTTFYDTTTNTVKYDNGTLLLELAAATNNLYSAQSADYTILNNDNVLTVGMTTGASNRTVTLPAAASNTARIIRIFKVDSGAGTLTVAGTINGITNNVYYRQYEYATYQSNGTTWDKLSGPLIGVSDGSTASAGYVGQELESSVTTTTNITTTNTYQNIATVSLTPGSWVLQGTILYQVNTGTGLGAIRAAISINSGNTTTDHVTSKNEVSGLAPDAASGNATLVIPGYTLNLTAASTTIYLKALMTFSGGTPIARSAFLIGRRVR
jgi:hypothetical protein